MRIMILTLILFAFGCGWGAFYSNWNPAAQMGAYFLGCLAIGLIIMAIIPEKKKISEK